MNLIKELTWRGMLQDLMPGTEEQLLKEKTTGYVGFDPTADSLHIGSLVPILLLIHLQRAGHQPVALLGGATGMIGDPSGKSEERNLLTEEQLQKNVDGIRKQLGKFLDFNMESETKPLIVNNYDWFKGMSFIDFLRDTGKHITVNYMMSKDSVRKRIEGDTGISYTEFAYQLMQGFDFYWLYIHHNCKLQMGGSDQWGNITTGAELVRRRAGGEAFAFTCPLITKADGGKFGKTEKGNVWLDAEKTSPYLFYQFWLNATDADAEKWIRIFTFLDQPTVEAMIEKHRADPGSRQLQKRLARELTVFVHGEEAYTKAVETTEKLFSNQTAPADSLSIDDLELMEGVVKFDFPASSIRDGLDIVSFLAASTISASKGEARKLVQQGGVSINRSRITEPGFVVDAGLLLHNKYILVQKGKKNYYLVSAAEG
ncbi:MAG TPA: tyrosine--tRNA ligase [Chryseolinea sp.]|nr:tyrosine--tRNA ligase [Chryseolinea sp.]